MENTSPQTTTPIQTDPPINPTDSSPIEPVSNPATPPAKNSRFSKKLLLVLLLLLFIIGIAGVGGFYFMNQNKTTEPVVTVSPTPEPTEQTVCTQEAKLCPDGVTYVGRSGPNCEFAPCPTSPNTSNFEEKIISITGNNAMFGNFTTKVKLNLPSGWNLSTSKGANGCVISKISSPTGFTMNLSFICNGWAAKYSAWPSNALIISQTNQTNQAGEITKYRIRLTNPDGSVNYVDADQKEKTMDAIMIQTAAPNESKDDYFFEVANLTASKGSNEELNIADKIAASIYLDSLEREIK